MRVPVIRLASGVLGWAALMAATAIAQEQSAVLLEEFDSRWPKRWTEQRLADRPNLFTTRTNEGNPALYVLSDRSASAVIHRLELSGVSQAALSWRWKIERGLSPNSNERRKGGDDYAARVFVIFGADLTDPDTRAICYVWAAGEPVGAQFANPFVGGVKTLVLRSGASAVGEWREESRNVAVDYRRVFGEALEQITGVAIMVDTDNTRSLATTWFDDFRLDVVVADEGR